MLREQLDQANSANQVLSEDIRKVTSDWTRSRKELEQREAAWRREEEVSPGGTGRPAGASWVQSDSDFRKRSGRAPLARCAL